MYARYLAMSLIVIPVLILLVLLASVIIGTFISELLYPLAEYTKIAEQIK
ncbi:hypothetical protein LCGC14_0474650 [marine sediment metagenome]|uniref:Uncharacterized protein n=1 Tax=marine sediment metagenome TaxID=412755 RepID=A0A0F9SBA1_9ZZZZ